jgi:hypothetical protein
VAFADALRVDRGPELPTTWTSSVRAKVLERSTLEEGEIVLEPFEQHHTSWLYDLGMRHDEVVELILGPPKPRGELRRARGWGWRVGFLAELWDRGLGGAWIVRDTDAMTTAGVIWALREPWLPWVAIAGIRVPDVDATVEQEARTIRLVADWVEAELGLTSYVPVPCLEERAIESAGLAGIEWRLVAPT